MLPIADLIVYLSLVNPSIWVPRPVYSHSSCTTPSEPQHTNYGWGLCFPLQGAMPGLPTVVAPAVGWLRAWQMSHTPYSVSMSWMDGGKYEGVCCLMGEDMTPRE